MHPFLFELFGFKVYAYGMTMVAAFIICLLMTVKNRSKDLLSLQDIYNLCLLAMASLLFGPKLAELVTQTAQGTIAMSSVLTLLKFWEPVSFSFLPVFLLAVILLFTYCRWKHIPILKVMDDLVPIAIFGVALQRCFGCFMGGCCYGTPTNLPWGIVFPGSSKAGIHFPGLNLHPTQLYYGMTALMIYFFLMRHRKHFKEHKKQGLQAGVVTGSGLIMLGLSYFVITFMRGDIPSRQIFFHLSISQYLSLALFATGLIIFLLKKRTIEKITGGHVKKTILMCFLAVCLIFTGTAYDVYSAAQNNIKKNAKKKLPPKDVRLFAGDLGSISNPVKCDGTQGQIEYLKRLRSPSRKSIKYRRLKHANPVPNGHTLDVYEIKSRDGRIRAVIHMDMYWPGYIESQAIKEFKIKESKGPKHITYRLETQPLTPHHVYQMILDYGFYCEIISGNPFHKEALQGINIPAKSVFPLRRSILDRKTNHGNIETWSQVEFNSRKTVETNIMLSWYPKIVNCSFDNAINILNNYNHEQKGGHFQWRIPTITELFSIIDSKSLLPGEFALRRGDDFTFWTSTPVMKKGTLLEASKSKKAYYIVRCRYININDTYSISFNYLDIEQKKPLKAHLLPVFSEKQYAYTAPVSTSAPPRSRNTVPQFSTVKKNKPGKNTVNSVSPAGSQNTIPGFSTNPKNRQRAGTKPSNTNSTATSQDKIPGFDDIPSKPSKKHPPTKKPVLKTPNVNRLRSTYTEPVKEKNQENTKKNLSMV